MPDSIIAPDASRELGGPDWLTERRTAAADRIVDQAPPRAEEEIWRYSRIDAFDPERYGPYTLDAPLGVPEPVRPVLEAMGDRAGVVITRNGRVVHHEIDETLAAEGVQIEDLASLPTPPEALGSVADQSIDWFVTLNDALLAGGVIVRVPAGVIVDHPILVLHWADAEGAALAPRVVLDVGDEARVTVLEHRSSPPVELLSTAVSEVVVGDNAHVRYLSVQAHAPQIWEVALQRAHVGRDARLTSGAVALGGSYARLRSESFVTGQGGESNLLAVYFGDGDQMLDFRTLQDHEAPRSVSDLLFKGAVEHRAHSVYSGLIRLRKSAQKADAHQTNRTLKLSPESHAESVPNLEILANDVSCTHASAIGPVDEDELHYLATRGIPPAVAERLIVFGFFEDVFERLPVGTLADPLREAVREKFERRQEGEEGVSDA